MTFEPQFHLGSLPQYFVTNDSSHWIYHAITIGTKSQDVFLVKKKKKKIQTLLVLRTLAKGNMSHCAMVST